MTSLVKPIMHIRNSLVSKCRSIPRSIGFHSTPHRFTQTNRVVLGIETSCDDTGIALIDESGKILGEHVESQLRFSMEFGGIIPTIACEFHEANLPKAIDQCLSQANMSMKDVDVVAASVKPGLVLCLLEGIKVAQELNEQFRIPFIPIHHMEAHALTATLFHDIPFPYLTLLMSGGHCITALVESESSFYRLGYCLDDPPGNVLDKTARMLNTKAIPEVSHLSGGAAIEVLARSGDPLGYRFSENIMINKRNAHFSFSGLRSRAVQMIEKEILEHDLQPNQFLPRINDFCASLQYTMLRHITRRLETAILYCEHTGRLPEKKTLVLSGGVASNIYFREGIRGLGEKYNCDIICPDPKYCTDNGVMIAWNGVLKLKKNIDVLPEMGLYRATNISPLGVDLSEDIVQMGVFCKAYKVPIHIPLPSSSSSS